MKNSNISTQGNLALAIQEAPSPAFKEGDKVQVIGTAYPVAGFMYEIVERLDPNGYWLKYADDSLSGMFWEAHELLPYTPALSIVPKAPVCPSALHEPKTVFVSATGRQFEAIEYSTERRVFMALDNAVSYCMEVVVEQLGENKIATVSTMNGRLVSRMEWLIDPRFVGRSFRYLENEQQAISGAYEFMQSLVMSGRA